MKISDDKPKHRTVTDIIKSLPRHIQKMVFKSYKDIEKRVNTMLYDEMSYEEFIRAVNCNFTIADPKKLRQRTHNYAACLYLQDILWPLGKKLGYIKSELPNEMEEIENNAKVSECSTDNTNVVTN